MRKSVLIYFAVVFNYCSILSAWDGSLSFIEEKIARAEVIEDPYPHMFITDFLPDDLYDELFDYLPRDFGSRECVRGVLNLELKSDLDAPILDQKREFLTEFNEKVLKAVGQALAKKFYPYLDSYLPELDLRKLYQPNSDMIQTATWLCFDKSNFEIIPHVDQWRRFLTAILYLPKDRDHEELGTEIFYGDDNCSLTDIREGVDSISFAKKIPYWPNTLFVMLRTKNAWHGVPKSPYKDRYIRKLFIHALVFPKNIMKDGYEGD